MHVILQSNYPSLGYVGDKVDVANGFARNFLIPRGIAVEASSRNEAYVRHILAGINKKRAKLRGEAEDIAKKLEGLILEFTLKIGEAGKAFGSVTAKDLEAALKTKGFDVIRKQIRTTDQMKKAGEYSVQIKLHSEVTGNITVRLINEAPPKVADESAEGGKKAAGKGKRGTRRAKTEGEEAAAPADAAPAAE